MLLQGKAKAFGNLVLALLDFGIVKLFHQPAVQTDNMVVVIAAIDLKGCLAGLEMVAGEQARLFKLGQHPVNRCQTNVHVFVHQQAVNILCCQVTNRAFFKQFKNLQAWQRGLQAHLFQVLRITHHFSVQWCFWCLTCVLPIVGGALILQGLRTADFGYDITLFPCFDISCALSMIKTPLIRGTRCRSALAALLLTGALAGCVTEYRIDVQQGNVLTQEVVGQLKPGMSKDQVRYLLGTPLLADMFHSNRWDYVYRMQNGKTGKVEERRLTVFFNAAGKLANLSGNVEAGAPGDLTAPVQNSQVIDLAAPLGGEAAKK